MHRKIGRWWFGYLRLQLWGPETERFFNMCSHHDIETWNWERKGDACCCNMKVRDFLRILPFAGKSKVKVRMIKRKGLPFLLKRAKKRKGWFIGILFACLLLFVSTSLLWNITFEGNVRFSKEQLTKFLRKSGYRMGMITNQIHCEKIEEEIRNAFPDITWVSAEAAGTVLHIRIKENEEKTEALATKEPCHIVSTVDCRILEIITRSGVAQVKTDTCVQEGEILISGSVPFLNDSQEITEIRNVPADGDVLGVYSLLYTDTFSCVEEIREYSGKETVFYKFFLDEQSWGISREPNFTEYDFVCETKNIPFLKILRNESGYRKFRYREYESRGICLTMGECEALARKRLDHYCETLKNEGTETKLESFQIEIIGSEVQVAAQLNATGPVGKKSALTEAVPLYE